MVVHRLAARRAGKRKSGVLPPASNARHTTGIRAHRAADPTATHGRSPCYCPSSMWGMCVLKQNWNGPSTPPHSGKPYCGATQENTDGGRRGWPNLVLEPPLPVSRHRQSWGPSTHPRHGKRKLVGNACPSLIMTLATCHTSERRGVKADNLEAAALALPRPRGRRNGPGQTCKTRRCSPPAIAPCRARLRARALRPRATGPSMRTTPAMPYFPQYGGPDVCANANH